MPLIIHSHIKARPINSRRSCFASLFSSYNRHFMPWSCLCTVKVPLSLTVHSRARR